MSQEPTSEKSGCIPMFAIFLAVVLSFCCMLYALGTNADRTFDLIAPVFGILAFLGIFISLRMAGKERSCSTALLMPLVFGLPALVLSFLVSSVGVVAGDALQWITHSATKPWGLAFISTVAIGGGITLFAIRKTLRCVYGATEVVVGAGIALYKADSIERLDKADMEFYLAILTASVYLIVRGLDNIDQGWNAKTKDPAAMLIVGWLRNRMGKKAPEASNEEQPTA